MTRETKAGIVISGAFVALLGTVLKHQMQYGEDTPDASPKLVAQAAPEKEKPVHPAANATKGEGPHEPVGKPAPTPLQPVAFTKPSSETLPLEPVPPHSSPSVSVPAPAPVNLPVPPPMPPPMREPMLEFGGTKATTGWETWLAAVPTATAPIVPSTIPTPPPSAPPVVPTTVPLMPAVSPPMPPMVSPPVEIVSPPPSVMPPVVPPPTVAPPAPPSSPVVPQPPAVIPPFPTVAPPPMPVERTAPVERDPNDNHSHFTPKNPMKAPPTETTPLVPAPTTPTPPSPAAPEPLAPLPPPASVGIPPATKPAPVTPPAAPEAIVRPVGAVEPKPAPLPPPMLVAPLPPAAPTAPHVVVTEEKRVEVKQGDTFESIALAEYRDAGYATLLRDFNQKDDLASPAMKSGKLQPGDKIAIPLAADLVKGSAPVTVAPAPSAPLPKYKVTAPTGETFYDIGKVVLGDANGSLKIQPLNPQFDPLKPMPAGTILTMPAGTVIPPANRP